MKTAAAKHKKSSSEMRQETTPLGSLQHEVGFEMAIYWYRVLEDINSDAFSGRIVTASYSSYLSGRRRKFGFDVHITINTGGLLRQHENHTG